MRRFTPGLVLAVIIPVTLAAAVAAAKRHHSPCTEESAQPGCLKRFHSVKLRPYTPKTFRDHGLKDRMTPKGRRARGFYLTSYWMFNVGAERTARIMKRAHLNTVVIDIKDELGRVLFPSKVPLSRGLQKHLLPDPKKTIATFHEHGIYVIARIVCFKDSRLPYLRPDLAVRTGPRARRLFSAHANWVDAYSGEVQDNLIQLAQDAQRLGFDEVQLDYIRFPKGRAGANATWLHRDGRSRSVLISGFLERLDRAVQLPVSADVYGLTTLVDGDPRRLGQTIEKMARFVEAISPMMYANGMSSYFKNNRITKRIYSVIHCGLWRARKKAAGIVLRPYLQAYPNRVESLFSPSFIRGQLIAAERAGSDGFLFWNATMRNHVAFRGIRSLGKQRVLDYGKNVGQHMDPRNLPGRWCKRKGEVFRPRRREVRVSAARSRKDL